MEWRLRSGKKFILKLLLFSKIQPIEALSDRDQYITWSKLFMTELSIRDVFPEIECPFWVNLFDLSRN